MNIGLKSNVHEIAEAYKTAYPNARILYPGKENFTSIKEKLEKGFKQLDILIKVKDMAILQDMCLRAFFESELWGIKHFGTVGRCAVISHSDFMKSVVNEEGKVLHLFSSDLSERYFDES